MRLVIYEWCCSGGLSGPDGARVLPPDAGREPLVREGRAMLEALLADAARDGGFDVVALVDESLVVRVPPSAERVDVPQGAEIERLVAAARRADATIVVAPETADVLAERVAAVRTAGGRVLAPGDGFIRLAADKQATVDSLAAAGVPVPAGRTLAAGEPWPEGFHRPAIRKARSSAGCDGVVVVGLDASPPRPACHAARLEAFCEGVPVGVSCIAGPGGPLPVAALRQRFSVDTAAYAGGEPLAAAAARTRAELLAVRAIRGLARRQDVPPAGWIGVDMILGRRDDGRDDRVLEVNPRVTTSFVGLAAASPSSLVRAVVDMAAGRRVDRRVLPSACRFSLTDATPRRGP